MGIALGFTMGASSTSLSAAFIATLDGALFCACGMAYIHQPEFCHITMAYKYWR